MDVVGDEELFGHLLLHAFVQVLGEFDLVLLLELNVVLDVVLGAFSRFLLVLFVLFIEFQLVSQCHLHDLWVRYELLLLVQVDLLEIGPILVRGGDVRPNLVEAGCGDKRFHFIQ